VSPLFLEALTVAIRAAAITDGDVDPTLGGAMVRSGYALDFSTLTAPPREATVALDGAVRPATLYASRRAGWRSIELHHEPPAVRAPSHIRLDLGATAKALAADRGASAIAAATGSGVLVALGGDIAVAGTAPPGGWAVRIADDHRAGADAPGQTVTIRSGGLATSSTTVRRWMHGGRVHHHVLDPATGAPAGGPWRTVSVAAASCVDANIASTAAIVRGAAALAWLDAQHLPARCVEHAGAVRLAGGWPEESPGARSVDPGGSSRRPDGPPGRPDGPPGRPDGQPEHGSGR
jgi:FAD:protein FMN transferase